MDRCVGMKIKFYGEITSVIYFTQNFRRVSERDAPIRTAHCLHTLMTIYYAHTYTTRINITTRNFLRTVTFRIPVTEAYYSTVLVFSSLALMRITISSQTNFVIGYHIFRSCFRKVVLLKSSILRQHWVTLKPSPLERLTRMRARCAQTIAFRKLQRSRAQVSHANLRLATSA